MREGMFFCNFVIYYKKLLLRNEKKWLFSKKRERAIFFPSTLLENKK